MFCSFPKGLNLCGKSFSLRTTRSCQLPEPLEELAAWLTRSGVAACCAGRARCCSRGCSDVTQQTRMSHPGRGPVPRTQGPLRGGTPHTQVLCLATKPSFPGTRSPPCHLPFPGGRRWRALLRLSPSCHRGDAAWETAFKAPTHLGT